MKDFVLRSGSHHDPKTGELHQFTPGRETVVTSEHDLAKAFPDRFHVKGENPDEPPPMNDEELTGEDMTDQFPKAKEFGLEVFYRQDRYVVTTAEDKSKAVEGSEGGFTSKKAVNEFLREQETEDKE